MIERVIERKCGHLEKIAIMGFSGHIDDIPLEYKEQVEKNTQWQRDKLCLRCFKKLSYEEKQKLLKEAKNG